MTDRELKKQLKKIGIIILLITLLIIILSVYTLGMSKAELSICNSQEYGNNLQVLGIDEQEFKQYLAIFGNLIDDNNNENEKIVNTATNLIEKMFTTYEVKINEQGLKTYDANMINQIAKEIRGVYVKDFEGENVYTYNEEDKKYIKNEIQDKIPYCIEIDEIVQNSEQIEVTYKLAIMTAEQMAEYMLNHQVNTDIKTIKASIMCNTDYQYSKYFVSDINEI